MAALKLRGWGHRSTGEFELEPDSGFYTAARSSAAPASYEGFAGFGQELKLAGKGVVLCSVFVQDGEAHLRIGADRWNLFEPGLAVEHRDTTFTCELNLSSPGRGHVAYRYRRKDILMAIIDAGYDALDFELANLPAAIPSMARRKKDELVAEWAARLLVPGAR